MKNPDSNISYKIKEAIRQNDFKTALALIEKVVSSEPRNESLLNLKAKIGDITDNRDITTAALESLILIAPHNLQYSITLAQLHVDNGNTTLAPVVFESLFDKFQHPDLYFNYAWFLTRAADYKEALINYKKSIELGLQGAEEAHLNIANIYSSWLFSPDMARQHLISAIKINPTYIDALYNLGNLEEDSGNRQAAIKQFEKIRAINPLHGKASARLALAMDTQHASTLISELEMLSQKSSVDINARIDCLYALGKLHDQEKSYEAAFNSWESANQLNKTMTGEFNQNVFSDGINKLMEAYSISWFDKVALCNDFSPVFIAGMFRSGSTLLEQMLSSHPEIMAAGELDYFPRIAQEMNAAYPPKTGYPSRDLESIADQYIEKLNAICPSGSIVTDKRPDNLLHLGLIKTVFPKARLIVTRRQIEDNCLSIFAHRLGNGMAYACDIKDTHFYATELNRLTEYWISLFADSIHLVSYDELVAHPKKVLTDTLHFLDLDWDSKCLDFHRSRNRVSTASVWQVRQPLYKDSSGRHHNYRSQIMTALN